MFNIKLYNNKKKQKKTHPGEKFVKICVMWIITCHVINNGKTRPVFFIYNDLTTYWAHVYSDTGDLLYVVFNHRSLFLRTRL